MCFVVSKIIIILLFNKIWNLQVDDSLQTIDVIYYLQKDGILLPFEDAVKVMSFVSNEFIHNQTGYKVVHKVRRKFNCCQFKMNLSLKHFCQVTTNKSGLHRNRQHLTGSI